MRIEVCPPIGPERELIEPVAIARLDGSLNRDAVGWARRPLQVCNLGPSISRVHAWDYWCVMNRACALTVLCADVRVAGVALVSFQDFAARSPIERVHVRPFGLSVRLPDTPHGEIDLHERRLQLSLRTSGPSGHALRIEGDMRTLLGKRIELDVTIERPETHETINVLVPWDDTHFQFTSKQQALPAHGVVRIDGREHRFERQPEHDAAFACLDFGRGRWPSRIEWCWAFAAGRRDGRTVGLNLGAKWTDDTGVTENGIVVDGRVHKIADAVDFTFDRRDYLRPWTVRTRSTRRVELRFTPLRERTIRVPLGLVSVELHQCIGSFSGTILGEDGEPIVIDDFIGQAESVRGRW